MNFLFVVFLFVSTFSFVSCGDDVTNNYYSGEEEAETEIVDSETGETAEEEAVAEEFEEFKITSMEFVTSCGSKSTTFKLTNGWNDVAILKITTNKPSTDPEIDKALLISSLRFNLKTDADLIGFSCERINGTGYNFVNYNPDIDHQEYVYNDYFGDTYFANISHMDTVNGIVEDSACFLIKANIMNMSASSQGYIQLGMDLQNEKNFEMHEIEVTGYASYSLGDSMYYKEEASIEATKISSSY